MFLFILLTILIALALLAARNDAAAKSSLDSDQWRARSVICQVFGRYCSQARAVAWCESRYRVWARNPGRDGRAGTSDDYLGLFQMGSYARARYGHGPGAWAQARAAYSYFVASGRDWSPWQCRP